MICPFSSSNCYDTPITTNALEIIHSNITAYELGANSPSSYLCLGASRTGKWIENAINTTGKISGTLNKTFRRILLLTWTVLNAMAPKTFCPKMVVNLCTWLLETWQQLSVLVCDPAVVNSGSHSSGLRRIDSMQHQAGGQMSMLTILSKTKACKHTFPKFSARRDFIGIDFNRFRNRASCE